MRRQTPQEKKKLSYERDRRNDYGNAPHAARRLIPLGKARRNRANRHLLNQPFKYTGPTPEEDYADEMESRMFQQVPREWKKHQDRPLGEVLAEKLGDRQAMRTRGGRRALRTLVVYKPEP
jgi:hypothetical protein